MKYEEWIMYERARLEDEKRRVIERLERDEEEARQKAKQDANEADLDLIDKGPISPNPPPLPSSLPPPH